MVTVSLQEQNGIYHAVINYKDKNGKRKQKWKSTRLKIKGNKKLAMKKAEEIRLQFEQQLELENYNEVSSKSVIDNITFFDYMQNWLKIVKPTIELNTYSSYEQMINYRIKNYFSASKLLLKDLSPLQIQEFYTSMLCDGLSSNTVVHYHAVIHKALDYAFKMNFISSNASDKVNLPKKEQYIGKFYSESELINLFEASQNDSLELVIYLTAFYGLRRSEILGLKWDAIDFDKKIITIKHTIVQADIDGKKTLISKDRTKNKSSYRTLPLVPATIEILQKFKEIQNNNRKLCGKSYNTKYNDYICVNSVGDLLKPDYISKHFKQLLIKNNLRIIRFHDLRHSCASLLLSNGISLKEIQEWLGHSNFNTTANIYTHLDTKVKENSANALSNIFDKQKNKSTFAEIDLIKNRLDFF